MGGYIYVFYIYIFTYTFYTYDYTCMYICIYVYFTLSPYTETTSAISLVRFFFWKPQVALQGFVPREWWGDGMKPSWAICGCWNGDLEYLEFVMYVYIYIHITYLFKRNIQNHRELFVCLLACLLVCWSCRCKCFFYIYMIFSCFMHRDTCGYIDIYYMLFTCFFIFLHVLFVQSLHTCILHTSPWFCCTFDQIWGLCIRYISFNRAYLWGYLEFNWFQQWQIQFSKFLVQFNSLLNYSHHSEQRYDDQAANYTPWN